jgi:hypothetical protein
VNRVENVSKQVSKDVGRTMEAEWVDLLIVEIVLFVVELVGEML